MQTLSGNGLSTLRIEPVRLADANVTIGCSADNSVAEPVHASAKLNVIPKGNYLVLQ